MTVGFVYILTSANHKVLYVGVTNDLQRRLYEHKNHIVLGYTSRYHVDQLVYFERYSDIKDAIAREKQLKGWTRVKKEWLIYRLNPEWVDLSQAWEI